MTTNELVVAGSRGGECHFCRLTPAGRGAVATIAVFGAAAAQCVDRHFRSASGGSLRALAIDRLAFGRWQGEDRAGEEVVAVRRPGDCVEIHCHGGEAAAAAIAASLAAVGCRPIAAEQFAAQRSPGRLEAEAWLALAQATTSRAAALLLAQFNGRLRTALGRAIECLGNGDSSAAMDILAELLVHAATGLHLTQPWRVVLAGQVNVGKSSLINALLGYQRAIVFDQPGTTRDVVTAATAIDGWPVELADTAGLRETDDAIESMGVQCARQRLADADLVLLVFDSALPWSAEDDRLVTAWPGAIVVHNKCDLVEPRRGVRVAEQRDYESSRPAGIATSARTGHGLPELLAAIAQRLVPHPPDGKAAVLFTRLQVAAIGDACIALSEDRFTEAIRAIESLL